MHPEELLLLLSTKREPKLPSRPHSSLRSEGILPAMELLALILLTASVAGLMWLSSRRRSRQRRDSLASLAQSLPARVEAGPGGMETARFERQGRPLEVLLDPTQEVTLLRIHFPEDEAPGTGNLRIRPRGARRLEDLARRPATSDALDPEFARRFQVESRPQDKGLLHHLLDAPGRKLVEDLSRLQGGEEEAFLDYRAPSRTLDLRLPGYACQPRDLDRLLGLGLQFADRLAPRPTRPEEAASLEV